VSNTKKRPVDKSLLQSGNGKFYNVSSGSDCNPAVWQAGADTKPFV